MKRDEVGWNHGTWEALPSPVDEINRSNSPMRVRTKRATHLPFMASSAKQAHVDNVDFMLLAIYTFPYMYKRLHADSCNCYPR